MLGHERDGVNEAACVQERLEIVVLLVSLDLFFKLVDIEVAFSMKLLLFKVLHSLESFFSSETSIEIVFSGLEWFIVNKGKNVEIIASGVDYLLPKSTIGILGKEEVINSIKERGIVELLCNSLQALLKSLVQLWVSNTSNTICIH